MSSFVSEFASSAFAARERRPLGVAAEGHSAMNAISAAGRAKGSNGRPGTSASASIRNAATAQRARITTELPEDGLLGRTSRAALGDEQAGRERDDEGRDLGDQTVADRELHEHVGRSRKRHAVAGRRR